MSEGKHTPGPWTAFYKNKYDEWHVSLPIAGSNMKLSLCSDGIQSENQEADARLIAAAPDLLDALKRLLRFVNAHTASGEVIPAQTVEHVRSLTAIAKAEGRS